jgi:hypothetical protein
MNDTSSLKFDTLVRHKYYGRGRVVAFSMYFYEPVGVQFDTPTGKPETCYGYGVNGYCAWVDRRDLTILTEPNNSRER